MFKTGGDLYWIIAGQVVSLLANFFILKILTSGLAIADYGYLILWTSTVLFLRQVLYDPISIIAGKKSIDQNFLGVQSLSGFQVIEFISRRIFFACAVILVFLVPISYLFNFGYVVFSMILAGFIYLTANGPQGIFINIINILNKRKLAATGVMADSLIKFFSISLFFLAGVLNLITTSALIALSSILSYLYIKYAANGIHENQKKDKAELSIISKKLVLLSAPLFPSTFLLAVKSVGDKIFMASFIGVEELAAYNVLFQLGFVPMMLIIGVIQTYVSPGLYKQAADKDNNFKLIGVINQQLIRIFYFTCVCLMVSFFVGDKIFMLLVGEQYLGYYKYLPYFVVAGALAGIATILNTGVIGLFDSKKTGKIVLGSVILSIVIVVVSIVYFGFVGGIAGLILSHLLSVTVFYVSLNTGRLK
jgi:O-antigen/teichoic acid export membrane protein